MPAEKYRIVRLASGAHSVHSLAHAETFHPVVGPVAEAEALYVRQLGLAKRVAATDGDFVVWDVGLGAAANPLTALRAVRGLPCSIWIESFDHTVEPLAFALTQTCHLDYLAGWERHLEKLVAGHRARFREGAAEVNWQVHVGDFPAFIASPRARAVAKPHVIMYDAFSPAANPAMWTIEVFSHVYRLLDPARPCALPTYSRSTMLRATLLLAGFFVGVGHATGAKEETTVAANSMGLISQPLDRLWLKRAQRSTSAEPLHEPVYRQARLSRETWEKLQAHPQFA